MLKRDPRPHYLSRQQLRVAYEALLSADDAGTRDLAAIRLEMLDRAQSLDTSTDANTLRSRDSSP